MTETGFSGAAPNFFSRSTTQKKQNTHAADQKPSAQKPEHTPNKTPNPDTKPTAHSQASQPHTHDSGAQQCIFGEILWDCETTKSGKHASRILMDNDKSFRIIHTTWSENNTRGYIYQEGLMPGSATLSFSLEKSPKTRKNRIEFMRVGPYSAEMINGRVSSIRCPPGCPRIPTTDVKSSGDLITLILSEAARNSKIWRHPISKRNPHKQ